MNNAYHPLALLAYGYQPTVFKHPRVMPLPILQQAARKTGVDIDRLAAFAVVDDENPTAQPEWQIWIKPEALHAPSVVTHATEPWYQHASEGKTYASIRGSGNEMVADCGSRSDTKAQANAARIVACVNACAGIHDPSAVPDLLAALRFVDGHCDPSDKRHILPDVVAHAVRAAIAKATAP